MLDITKDILSLTTLRRRSGDFMKQLKRSKRPTFFDQFDRDAVPRAWRCAWLRTVINK